MVARIRLNVPGEISAPARKKAREAAVHTLWQEGKISASRAVEELGLTAHEFLDLLAAKGLPVIGDFDPEVVEDAKQRLRAADPP